MAPTDSKDRQKKYRERKKLLARGEILPSNLEIQKSGPKPSANSNANDLLWKRFKHEHSQIRGKAMVL
jgi:hypothetical protein